MNEAISNLAAELKAAVLGKPRPTDPTENTATIICEFALPEVKKLDGWKDWLAGEVKIAALMHDVNFVLTESYAHQLYQKQLDEHTEHASSGKSLTEISRGRSRDAWIEDVASRNAAAQAAAMQLSATLQPFRRKISAIVVQTLNEHSATLMLAESKLGAAYGLTYEETPTLKKLRSLQNYLAATAAGIVYKLLK